MKGIVEEGETVGGWIEAEERIISIDRGVCIRSPLLQSFAGFLGDRIVLEVIVGVVESSFGFGRHGKSVVGNVVAAARRLLGSTDALRKRCDAYPPKSSVE